MELVTNEKTLDPDRKINYQFKVLYAIGIIFVVAGHAHGNEFIFLNELMHCTTYYMAMFVFSSGYFYSSTYDYSPIKYIVKKIKRLMIPYFLWNIAYGLIVFVLSKFNFTIGTPVTFEKLTYACLLGLPQFSFNIPGWFVAPLFATEVYNVLLRYVLIKIPEKQKNIIMLLFNFILGITGIWLSEKGINTGIFLYATRLMYFVPFYTLGYFYRLYLEKKDTLPNVYYFSIIIIIDLLVILFNGQSPEYQVISMVDFPDPFSPFFLGIVGIAFWLRISRILVPVVGKSKYLILIANNTFSIMMHHVFGFFVLKGMFYFASRIFSFLPEFKLEEYMSDVAYLYLPRGRGIPLLYVLFGIAFSLLIKFTVDKIKLFVLKKISFFHKPVSEGEI